MYRLKTSAAFDSAHFLAGYNGKCANLHGHTWTVEVEAGAETLTESGEKRGMVIDFGDLKQAVRALADSYDHAMIYESGSLRETTVFALQDEGFRLIEVPYRPTAENFAKAFYEALREAGLPVLRVTVYETPANCASYEV
ncbi:MAG: 6-carboxytetrahydropterin synthase QueD [Oscillospiraceae bacterium]|nr:6-carboxytetrahydropterin synthase QueD [Oscillospiraceae bacterium]